MGTNTRPKPNQLGAARPSRSQGDIVQCPPEQIWEWTGDLLDVEDGPSADTLEGVCVGGNLGPIAVDGGVFAAVGNAIVGRFPALPALAIAEALEVGSAICIRVIGVNSQVGLVTVHVQVRM